jgi:hypothetical protein
MRVFEMFDGGSGSGFELDDSMSVICRFGIDDDFQFHAIVEHDVFESYSR